MTANIPQIAGHLIQEYRRFLKTSYRFLDPHLRKQFDQQLSKADVIVRGPYVTLARDFERGATLKELSGQGKFEPELLKARWPFMEGRLFLHQQRALEAGRAGRSFVVTTGTGSGKTEAFLLPILDGVMRMKRDGVAGVKALLLYPMNALANDQLERLRRLLRGTGLDFSFGLYTGESDATVKNLREEPAENERTSRAAIRRQPPDLLLTNYKQLEFLLVRAEDRGLFTPSLRYLVLDELHAYRGALATEIACLIRRLKAHSGTTGGRLTGMATSATVSGGGEGPAALARFASTLFGQAFQPEDIIGESLLPPQGGGRGGAGWVPPAPMLAPDDLLEIDLKNEQSLLALTRRLTGRQCPPDGPLADRIAGAMEGNAVVSALEDLFAEPRSLDDAAKELRLRFPDREARSLEDVRLEIEAYLLAGSAGDEEHPPRLRPKLHTFFHGVYDVNLCLNPDCRTLVPHGGEQCLRCGSAARPAALCRTCGQDFVKVRFQREGDDRPVGTGDFYSSEMTAFLTHGLLSLDDAPGVEDEETEAVETAPKQKAAAKARKGEHEGKGDGVYLCPGCGRMVSAGSVSDCCNRDAVTMIIYKGKLNTCPACGDTNTRADIVTPLRTGTASSVSVLGTHHLDRLEGEDRKLLVFADNRQDVAHQAGYTSDKHRSFALRHFIAAEVQKSKGRGTYLQELPETVLDQYRRIGIIPRNPSRPEKERWQLAITFETANEFTRYSRQRASLENLGLVAVEYEFLENLDPRNLEAVAGQAGLDVATVRTFARVLLDIMRKNRAVAYSFFQEYVDPATKARYRVLEEEPYGVRFPLRDRMPKAFALDRPDHIRKSGRLLGFIQENEKAGQLAAPQKVAFRLLGDREAAGNLIRALVKLLEKAEILIHVPDFYIPKKEQVRGLRPLQIDPRVIRLMTPPEGFRCNACQAWRPYALPTCPTPRCRQGRLVATEPDPENYYVRLYRDRSPQRMRVSEHSAQVPGPERARRETAFKDGHLDMMICSPTLELGVDIGPLLTVVLRNAPPTPANYIQRVGRAGRRLRIGFASTFCAGGAHDRHAFEEPEWLVSGRFEPPRLRLDNPKIVRRHLRSFLLECVEEQLPTSMGDFLDDARTPTRWLPEKLERLLREAGHRKEALVKRLSEVMHADREAGRLSRYGPEEVREIVAGLEKDLMGVLDGWWQRVAQIDREFRQYAAVGSPRHDMRKAQARQRAYKELTEDPERAYTLNYLSTRGLLPAYQFPLDTFSLDPGVTDTGTLYRASTIAIEEFAPGNFVYANGHKLQSIRALFSGGPGQPGGRLGRTDAETSGRLQAFHFCGDCEEVTEAAKNSCPQCGKALEPAVDVVFVDAFEAEENKRISSEEESRDRQMQDRRENLLVPEGTPCRLYPYPLSPVEYMHLAEILVTNWGRPDHKSAAGVKFHLCPDCGRHMPYDPKRDDLQKKIKVWHDDHARFCSGRPSELVLAFKFPTDCLVLTVPARGDAMTRGRLTRSPMAVTLAESLLAGAGELLELEPGELHAFVRKSPEGASGEQIVFYETVPGGAGYVEEIASRLAEVARAAEKRLFRHECQKACYLCLKHYRNQGWHPFFNKEAILELLLILSEQEPVAAVERQAGEGQRELVRMLDLRRREAAAGAVKDPATGKYRRGPIEESLLAALSRIPELPPGQRDLEIKEGDRLITVPDFAWDDVKLAVYCDGYAVHGAVETLALDAEKRNFLQGRGWTVLTYWGRTIIKDAGRCARQIADLYKKRAARR